MNRNSLIALFAPACVFQSVMIGGGYGTGREIVQYFTQYGLWGGIGSLCVAFLMFGLLLAFMFEAARAFQSFDYRTLFKPILGPLFPLFEIINILMLILVMAVVGAASSQILQDSFGIPHLLGIGLMLVPIAALTFFGADIVTKVLMWSSAYLYVIFISFLIITLVQTDDIYNALMLAPAVKDGWAVSGLQYAFYNCAAAPFVLYSVRAIPSRKMAIGAGIIAASFAVLPALFFHIAMTTRYDMVIGAELPAYAIMRQFGSVIFLVFFSVMLFVTFVETGAGMLQGLNDRIDGHYREATGKSLTRTVRAAIAVGAVLSSVLLSQFGVKDLIANGYGTIAWLYLFIFIIPMFVSGTRRMISAQRARSTSGK